jgi:hypothetical protein
MPAGEARVGNEVSLADSLTRVEGACRLAESRKGMAESRKSLQRAVVQFEFQPLLSQFEKFKLSHYTAIL